MPRRSAPISTNNPPPLTPDGRYIVVRGRLWRAVNPALSEGQRQALVDRLMAARRAIATTRQRGDERMQAAARREVHAIKVALGERGPVWWSDGAPDLNRHMVANTPYADWFGGQG